jgi:hypothetical protein
MKWATALGACLGNNSQVMRPSEVSMTAVGPLGAVGISSGCCAGRDAARHTAKAAAWNARTSFMVLLKAILRWRSGTVAETGCLEHGWAIRQTGDDPPVRRLTALPPSSNKQSAPVLVRQAFIYGSRVSRTFAWEVLSQATRDSVAARTQERAKSYPGPSGRQRCSMADSLTDAAF